MGNAEQELTIPACVTPVIDEVKVSTACDCNANDEDVCDAKDKPTDDTEPIVTSLLLSPLLSGSDLIEAIGDAALTIAAAGGSNSVEVLTDADTVGCCAVSEDAAVLN